MMHWPLCCVTPLVEDALQVEDVDVDCPTMMVSITRDGTLDEDIGLTPIPGFDASALQGFLAEQSPMALAGPTLLRPMLLPKVGTRRPAFTDKDQMSPGLLKDQASCRAPMCYTPGPLTARSRKSVGSRRSAESAEELSESESDVEDRSTSAGGSGRLRASGSTMLTASTSGSNLSSLGFQLPLDEDCDDENAATMLYPWEQEAMEALASARGEGAHQLLSPTIRRSASGDGTTGDTALCQPTRAKTFYVDIDRRIEGSDALARLGLDTRPLVSVVTGALIVERIQKGGLVDEWNRSCSSQITTRAAAAAKGRHRIRKGDLIVEVNGIRGSSEGLYKEIAQEPSLRLVVMRLHGEGKGGAGRRQRTQELEGRQLRQPDP
mmetsp:Transcript_100922/g.271101  ORF Transcript_100922/g.271101 Transcript_100922/m.271101 type:complete len:379 (-) Transcript_100922:316-1452(-)